MNQQQAVPSTVGKDEFFRVQSYINKHLSTLDKEACRQEYKTWAYIQNMMDTYSDLEKESFSVEELSSRYDNVVYIVHLFFGISDDFRAQAILIVNAFDTLKDSLQTNTQPTE